MTTPDDSHPHIDAILATPLKMYRAKMRVQWRHLKALLFAGVPMEELLDLDLTFGVVMVQGRELIVTDDDGLLAYLPGPVMVGFPDGIVP